MWKRTAYTYQSLELSCRAKIGAMQIFRDLHVRRVCTRLLLGGDQQGLSVCLPSKDHDRLLVAHTNQRGCNATPHQRSADIAPGCENSFGCFVVSVTDCRCAALTVYKFGVLARLSSVLRPGVGFDWSTLPRSFLTTGWNFRMVVLIY